MFQDWSEVVTFLRRVFLLFIMLGSLFACATETLNETFVSEPYVRERWLPFLADGKTEKSGIIQRLGEPTSSFQNHAILGYRLILVEEGRELQEEEYRKIIIQHDVAYVTPYYGWVNNRRKQLSEQGSLLTLREENKDDRLLDILTREAEYSLILIFDDQGVLAKHDLRRVMP
jgi:hypothetical protein